jgi:hypothetical protein
VRARSPLQNGALTGDAATSRCAPRAGQVSCRAERSRSTSPTSTTSLRLRRLSRP